MSCKPAGFVLSRREEEKALNDKIWKISKIYYAVMSGPADDPRKPGIPTQTSSISTFNKMALNLWEMIKRGVKEA